MTFVVRVAEGCFEDWQPLIATTKRVVYVKLIIFIEILLFIASLLRVNFEFVITSSFLINNLIKGKFLYFRTYANLMEYDRNCWHKYSLSKPSLS